MSVVKKNWWKILPFVLFFFGGFGAIVFIVLCILYAATQFVLKIVLKNSKIGKFLTFLIVIQIVLLITEIILGFVNHFDWYTLLVWGLEIICLAGIIQKKRVAAISLIVLFSFELAQVLFLSVSTLTGKLLYIVIFIIWTFLWLKAFKRKWELFK